MTVLVFGLFVAVVLVLTWLSRRFGTTGDGCCAPADPRRDLRIRVAVNEFSTSEAYADENLNDQRIVDDGS